MFVVRPVKKDDLDSIMELLTLSGHGLTTLPKDPEVIARKLEFSERCIRYRPEKPNGESYLFVMEDVFSGRIVGISGIISKIGGFEPYFFYRLKEREYVSKMLGKRKLVKSLHVEKTHAGPAEICSLFLHPEFRNAQNGRLLSLSRFLFLKENRDIFEDEVIAEMRGRVNKNGYSPFWNAVGKNFMDIEFIEADYLSMKSKSFIEELLPNYPILVDLLPKDAQEVIGEVHKHTEPARHILEREGFSFKGLVGIFEPGPILHAETDKLRIVKELKKKKIKEITNKKIKSDIHILSRVGESFKCSMGPLQVNDGGITITEVTAAGLNLKIGDSVWYAKLKYSD